MKIIEVAIFQPHKLNRYALINLKYVTLRIAIYKVFCNFVLNYNIHYSDKLGKDKMKRMLLAALCCLLQAMTIDASNILVLHWTSGTTTTYVLVADQPRLTFSGDSIIVTTKNSETHIGMGEVCSFDYDLDNQTTGISKVHTGQAISLKDNHLDINGLPSGSNVDICDTAGRIYKSLKANQDGQCSLSIDSLPKGAYIIRCAKFATKIIKK